MSIWIFLSLGRLFNVHEPTELARACQLMNCAALILVVAFAFLLVPADEREPWLWAAALAAVNPLAVLFQRKIWPGSILPLTLLLLLAAWWRREKPVASFFWGFLGGLLGQIQAAGFYYAAGFVLWGALFDRKRIAWIPWFLGSLLSTIAMIPWFNMLSAGVRQFNAGPHITWVHIGEFRFWTYWITEPLGISLQYSLGEDFVDFLKFPFWHGHPTYLTAIFHGAMLVAGIMIYWQALRGLTAKYHQWRDLCIGHHSPTLFTINSILWGFGILLTLSCLPIHRHYLLVTFPAMYLWLAWLALRSPDRLRHMGRRLLFTIIICQLFISLSFLGFIHQHPREIRGDYGLPYKLQSR